MAGADKDVVIALFKYCLQKFYPMSAVMKADDKKVAVGALRRIIYRRQERKISLDQARKMLSLALRLDAPAVLYAYADVDALLAMSDEDARRYLRGLARYVDDEHIRRWLFRVEIEER